MKEINMYIRGNVYGRSGVYGIDDSLKGQYIVIMEYKGASKELYNIESGGSVTPNRMLIKGLIDGLRSLKESCRINLYTHTHVGLGKLTGGKGRKIEGVRKSVNKDLLLILKEELDKGKHEIIETVGKQRQWELGDKLRKYKEQAQY